MLFYMPSWGLTSAITMAHIPSDLFPRVRVFGAVGWVASGLFSLFAVNVFGVARFDGTNLPFYCAAGTALLAALLNLTLPDTPPPAKGKKASLLDVMGFRSVTLMRNRNFSVFIILSFFATIPFAMYWSYFSEYLLGSGYQYITITMNTGQLAEIFILLTVPFSIKKFGLRNTMIYGLIAMIIRYAAFLVTGSDASIFFVMTGVLMHGFIFGYFYLGGQIYIDRKAPVTLQSQGQGFIFFVTFGLGLLAGNFVNGEIIRYFSEETMAGMVPDWGSIWGVTTAMALLVMLAFWLFFKKERYEKIEIDKA